MNFDIQYIQVLCFLSLLGKTSVDVLFKKPKLSLTLKTCCISEKIDSFLFHLFVNLKHKLLLKQLHKIYS